MSVKQKKPSPPVLNGKYQDRKNTNQNQMKNTCYFYIGFQVLKVLLIKICKIQPLPESFLSCCFLLVFKSADAIFQKFLNFIQLCLMKKDFRHKFHFFNGFPHTSSPPPLKKQQKKQSQNPKQPPKSVKRDKCFLSMLPYLLRFVKIIMLWWR